MGIPCRRNTAGYSLAELEADRDALLASLMDITPIALDSLTPEERHRFYRMLDLRVIA